MNRWFAAAGLEQHPGKTYIGRVSHGLDWLGYQFDGTGLCGIAARCRENAQMKLHRLYEQARLKDNDTFVAFGRAMEYHKHWLRWTRAGLDNQQPRCSPIVPAYANPWEVMMPVGMAVI